MSIARWSLRVVLVALLIGWGLHGLPQSWRFGLRSALRLPSETEMHVRDVVATRHPGPGNTVGPPSWIVEDSTHVMETTDPRLASALQPGHTYRLRYLGDYEGEECDLVGVVADLGRSQ